MIVGMGIDLVDVGRMTVVMERHPDRAPRRLFTSEERAACAGRREPAECYAARFAAKEACLKALGTGLGHGITWHDIQVVTDPAGKPALRLGGPARERLERIGGARTHLSFSHEGGSSVALVVIED